ncbi:MAG: fibrillarin-like rRNA/tRNA 2'-O-methyltransferase [Thermoplasmata archaeon]|nr:fibrillarin-like rRNA/tRNA 2'-O-methyltransferase [Thermoplasmata archaeon]
MGSRVPNAFVRQGRLYTANLARGPAYGERVVRADGREYREWSPSRSKLAEYLGRSGPFPIAEDSSVLYLGAGSGTTVSHVSDIVARGMVFAVEVAPIPFFRLLDVSAERPNVVPVLADARRPERYAPIVGGTVDAVYQDVSQRDQVDIFRRNLDAFGARWGVLMLKARSISHRPADEVVAAELAKLDGLEVTPVNVTASHPEHRAFHVAR